MRSDTSLATYFIKHARTYKWRFLISFLLMPLSAWLAVQGPVLIKQAIDEGVGKKNLEVLQETAWLYLAVVVMATVIQVVQNL